jgi:two-component system CheB/CheR fusion protein
VKDARTVLTDFVPIQREVEGRDGRCYDLRLRPYRTVEDEIDGVVITFLDVTEQQKIEVALRKSEGSLRRQLQLIELSHEPIFVWDFDGGILEWNRGSEQLYGYSRQEALGTIKSELLKTVVPDSNFEKVRIALLRDGDWSGELVQTTSDGRKLTVESRIHLEVVDERRLVLESTRDITDRKRLERRQQLLLRELGHRVKNTLAVVQSIARQTLRKTTSPADFMARLEGRLSALAKAHDLLLRSDWRGANLDALARIQLDIYTPDDPERLRIEGPPVALSADVAMPLALVLHELATNAAKYGPCRGRTARSLWPGPSRRKVRRMSFPLSGTKRARCRCRSSPWRGWERR